MEWFHVSDLVDNRHVDPDFIPKILAYIEAKTAYETLSKVLQLLYEARRAGLVSEKLVDIISDWLMNVEEEYRFMAWEIDGWFKAATDTLTKIIEKQTEKPKETPKT